MRQRKEENKTDASSSSHRPILRLVNKTTKLIIWRLICHSGWRFSSQEWRTARPSTTNERKQNKNRLRTGNEDTLKFIRRMPSLGCRENEIRFSAIAWFISFFPRPGRQRCFFLSILIPYSTHWAKKKHKWDLPFFCQFCHEMIISRSIFWKRWFL